MSPKVAVDFRLIDDTDDSFDVKARSSTTSSSTEEHPASPATSEASSSTAAAPANGTYRLCLERPPEPAKPKPAGLCSSLSPSHSLDTTVKKGLFQFFFFLLLIVLVFECSCSNVVYFELIICAPSCGKIVFQLSSIHPVGPTLASSLPACLSFNLLIFL